MKTKAYLAGRMSKNPNDVKWREEITPFLEELGFEVLNPYKLEPLQLKGLRPSRLPEGFQHWYELRDSEDPLHVERFMKYMRRIIKFDIHIVNNIADLVIVYWDKGCKDGAGTHSEMTSAFITGKPVYCVLEKGTRLPAWARGCCEELFDSFEDLKKFLVEDWSERD